MNGYTGEKRRLPQADAPHRGPGPRHRQMIENDQYCIDVLAQVSAATKALEAVALGLLDEHLTHCVTQAAAEGGAVADQKIAEASAAIARLVKS